MSDFEKFSKAVSAGFWQYQKEAWPEIYDTPKELRQQNCKHDCGQYRHLSDGLCCAGCDMPMAPKPATPVPEWKAENVAAGLLAYEYNPQSGALTEIRPDDLYLPPTRHETTCAECGKVEGHKWTCSYNAYSHPSGNCPGDHACGMHPEPDPIAAANDSVADHLRDKIAEAYQLVGYLADKAGVFDTDAIQQCLDQLSNPDDFLGVDLPDYQGMLAQGGDDPLSRAMRQPGPHDGDLNSRVMPWRRK